MPQVTRQIARWALVSALCAAALAGCRKGDDTLEGSLGEVIDLSFDDVEVSITEWNVIIGYHRPHGEGRDIVFKLVANKRPDEVVRGEEIDLAPLPDGTAVASCTRSVADDPIRTFAAIKTGMLKLDRVPEIDGVVGGSFRVTLAEGGDAGKGRTAFGSFRVLKVVPGN